MTPGTVDPKQAAYAAQRRAWRAAVANWLRGGRLKFLKVRTGGEEG